ncbi:MAG: MoxR family ATPase [bacterium]|nr:MoxR family ATPase [bacterium]
MPCTLEQAHNLGVAIIRNVKGVIVDKDDVILKATATVLAGGNILFEDVPGVGKTVLCRALAKSIGGTFSRVQCTPDLLPSDLLGTTIYERSSEQFKFHPGPVFSNLLLADEINRATPKMQSALLECMEEHQATVNGNTHTLPTPFIVVATQNPIEYEGTFPLPEAQLDRFAVKLHMGYPSLEAEAQLLEDQRLEHPLEKLQAVCSNNDLAEAIQCIRTVRLEANVRRYIVAVVDATRHNDQISLGASPRASQTLYRLSQAWAVLHKRDYVLPDDIKDLAPIVLEHRLILADQDFREASWAAEKLIGDILNSVQVP